MFELMALAYQGNLTRVTSFMMARELSTLSYPQIGVADGHHPVSHNNNIPEQVAKKIKVDIYHLDLFAQFLDKLRQTPDGDGSLLDHSLFLYGSGMTNGNQHDHENLPTLLVGGAAGKHKGNRHIKMAKSTPLSNLMLSIMDTAGIDTEKFGQSSGRVEPVGNLVRERHARTRRRRLGPGRAGRGVGAGPRGRRRGAAGRGRQEAGRRRRAVAAAAARRRWTRRTPRA